MCRNLLPKKITAGTVLINARFLLLKTQSLSAAGGGEEEEEGRNEKNREQLGERRREKKGEKWGKENQDRAENREEMGVD